MAFRKITVINAESGLPEETAQKGPGGQLTKLPPKEVPVVIPKEIGPFLDEADVPHVTIPQAKGRKTLPVGHRLVRAYVIDSLYNLSGGRLPGRADVDAFISLIEAQALLNGQKVQEPDWEDNVLEEDPLTLCLCILIERKAPQPLEATAGQLLEAVNVLASKENIDKGDDWPKAENRMSMAIKQRQVILQQLGIAAAKLKRQGSARKWRFQMIQDDAGDATASDASPDASPDASQHKSFGGNDLGPSPAESDALAASLLEIATQEGPAKLLNDVDILQWFPDRWEQIVANESAVKHQKAIVEDLLAGGRGHNLALTGVEGTGRGTLALHGVQSLLCEATDAEHLDPCGECDACLFGYGADNEFGDPRRIDQFKFQFLQVHGARLRPDKLVYEQSKVQGHDGRLFVYLSHLDELPLLMVQELLDTMKDERFIWFATAPGAGDVAPEILKHFAVEQTARPTEEQLARFLAERCQEWGIKVDSGHTLLRLAHRCGQVTSDALRVLALATKQPDRRLTAEVVEETFDVK